MTLGRDPAFAAAPSSQSSLSRPDGLQSGVGRERLIDFLNAFKADPFSTGADKVDRLIQIIGGAA